MKSAEFWLDFTEVLKILTESLSHEWPVELLPVEEERTEAFWMAACREEMRTRHTLSAKIQALLAGPERQPMTPLEEWLLRRRVDWALQLGMAKFEEDILPPVSLQEVLEWALVKTWESDGCQGMWLHAERGGEQHPEAPGWLRDVR